MSDIWIMTAADLTSFIIICFVIYIYIYIYIYKYSFILGSPDLLNIYILLNIYTGQSV